MLKAINLKWALIIVVAVGLFCWVSVRPYVDRKQCHQYAVDQVKPYGNTVNEKLFTMYGMNYTLCVNSKGLAE